LVLYHATHTFFFFLRTRFTFATHIPAYRVTLLHALICTPHCGLPLHDLTALHVRVQLRTLLAQVSRRRLRTAHTPPLRATLQFHSTPIPSSATLPPARVYTGLVLRFVLLRTCTPHVAVHRRVSSLMVAISRLHRAPRYAHFLRVCSAFVLSTARTWFLPHFTHYTLPHAPLAPTLYTAVLTYLVLHTTHLPTTLVSLLPTFGSCSRFTHTFYMVHFPGSSHTGLHLRVGLSFHTRLQFTQLLGLPPLPQALRCSCRFTAPRLTTRTVPGFTVCSLPFGLPLPPGLVGFGYTARLYYHTRTLPHLYGSSRVYRRTRSVATSFLRGPHTLHTAHGHARTCLHVSYAHTLRSRFLRAGFSHHRLVSRHLPVHRAHRAKTRHAGFRFAPRSRTAHGSRFAHTCGHIPFRSSCMVRAPAFRTFHISCLRFTFGVVLDCVPCWVTGTRSHTALPFLTVYHRLPLPPLRYGTPSVCAPVLRLTLVHSLRLLPALVWFTPHV